MNQNSRYKMLAATFGLAGAFFAVGTVNHIVNTGEGALSSILLALGSLCIAWAIWPKEK